MSATQYRVMYRYVNETTNTVITNNMENEYVPTLELYWDKHKLYAGNEQQKLEAEQERDEIIAIGNSADNPKTNMLFAYNGTKKILSKEWKTNQYIDSTSYPYLIKDEYIRIPMSPWIIFGIYGSIDMALDRAKVLVDMVGIDNVKVMKVVAFDQFVKIQ